MQFSDTTIKQAALYLLDGGLVALPTETVYGLGADALNKDAVERIYSVKGRPTNHPLIVHVHKDADLNFWCSEIPDDAKKLIKAFWPGPLTLVLPKSQNVPDYITGGQSTVAIRSPNHPIAQAVLLEFSKLKNNAGIVAPSANLFGHVSPTKNEHVKDEFPSDNIYFIDGGSSEVGIESTILDLSRPKIGPVILRPGHITKKDIYKVLGVEPKDKDISAPVVSGSLKSHYAPKIPIYPLDDISNLDFINHLKHKKVAIIYHSNNHYDILNEIDVIYYKLPSLSTEYASKIYETLRKIESQNMDLILLESLPLDAEWDAVRDRMNRALATYK
ncbi:L-threonylcarbamoyladenylate synthase [Taylorella equigenitalis]|uniref:Threonylcarbamoyl-AMP synthase n=1 Tax=Taylorella equigenitalis (strain MCE9) TaxID=937774 RepID=A0A654KFU5_TAYEM|nr:L-threonylcarbamoyladenylate synthase [Taylorella equigenitalis]ADU91291.1 Sua5 subfamily-like protein [Taylorella equigenitalis MCE9]WDU56109.1 threonylcarbamoyl-AMP synthase [Taylorella equigenitalis]